MTDYRASTPPLVNTNVQCYDVAMESVLNIHAWIEFFILLSLEITLSADNIVFLVTCSSKLPIKQQAPARKIGLLLAMITRILFLGLIFSASTWITPFILQFSIRDLIFIAGGLFLVVNSLVEFKEMRAEADKKIRKRYAKFTIVLIQIMIIDIIFSIDSVFTAIGVSQHYWVMVSAIVVATLFMLLASEYLNRWMIEHPILKVLALCFLVLIGGVLILRGFEVEVHNGYIYVPFLFALFTHTALKYTRPIRN